MAKKAVLYTHEHDPLQRTPITKADVDRIALFGGLEPRQVESVMRLTVLAIEEHERNG